MNKNFFKPIKKLFKKIAVLFYRKIFRINDTPHKIALGLSIGVFSGILPGTGPLAALFLAFILRANRAAALIGSLATNTWLSIVLFLASIKTGSLILNISYKDVQEKWVLFLGNFHWLELFKLSVFKVVLPVVLGYLVLSMGLALAVYLAGLIIILRIKHKTNTR